MLNEELLTAAVPISDVDHVKLTTALAEELLAAARAAQNFAYAPYSNFAVGAAVAVE